VLLRRPALKALTALTRGVVRQWFSIEILLFDAFYGVLLVGAESDDFERLLSADFPFGAAAPPTEELPRDAMSKI
jgi:hypothetical protein